MSLSAIALPAPAVSGETSPFRNPQPVRSLIANVPVSVPPPAGVNPGALRFHADGFLAWQFAPPPSGRPRTVTDGTFTRTRVDTVIDYAEPMTAPGFYFMNSPGNDLEGIAGQIGAGCNLLIFVTGNGSITKVEAAPNKMYQLLDLGMFKTETVVDGKSARQGNGQGLQALSGEELEGMLESSHILSEAYVSDLNGKLTLTVKDAGGATATTATAACSEKPALSATGVCVETGAEPEATFKVTNTGGTLLTDYTYTVVDSSGATVANGTLNKLKTGESQDIVVKGYYGKLTLTVTFGFGPIVLMLARRAGGHHVSWQWGPILGLALAAAAVLLSVRDLRTEAARVRDEFSGGISTFLFLVAMSMEAGKGHAEALPAAAKMGANRVDESRGFETRVFSELRETIRLAPDMAMTSWGALGRLGERYGIRELVTLRSSIQLASDDGARVKQSIVSLAKSMQSARLGATLERSNNATESMRQLTVIAAGLAGVYLAAPYILSLRSAAGLPG